MPLGPLTVALLYPVVLVRPHVPIFPKPQRSLGAKRSQLIHAVVSALLLLTLFPALFLAGYGSLFRFWRPAMRAAPSPASSRAPWSTSLLASAILGSMYSLMDSYILMMARGSTFVKRMMLISYHC
jgi:hypothetical protein